jgi:hypothetical protein
MCYEPEVQGFQYERNPYVCDTCSLNVFGFKAFSNNCIQQPSGFIVLSNIVILTFYKTLQM